MRDDKRFTFRIKLNLNIVLHNTSERRSGGSKWTRSHLFTLEKVVLRETN